MALSVAPNKERSMSDCVVCHVMNIFDSRHSEQLGGGNLIEKYFSLTTLRSLYFFFRLAGTYGIPVACLCKHSFSNERCASSKYDLLICLYTSAD